MGICSSTDGNAQAGANTKINREIAKDRIRDLTTIKMLLLGAGECGKSTVLKQMKFLHADGFSESDIEQRKYIIYSNTVTSMAALVNAMDALGLPYSNSDRNKHGKLVLDTITKGEDLLRFSEPLYLALKTLWADGGVQKCYERRNEYQINDSAKYFLDAIDRVYNPAYTPTTDDILHMRVATTGVLETDFKIKGVAFKVFDVGGQRSERRKWIHCFDNVNSVIFIIAVSEFDQVLMEDLTTNRMKEAMTLYGSVLNSQWFAKASMILFLNKTDLFDQKLKSGKSIRSVFPNYAGDNTYTSSLSFINEHLKGMNEDMNKNVYSHETCATDSDQVSKVLNSVLDTVIGQNLKTAGVV